MTRDEIVVLAVGGLTLWCLLLVVWWMVSRRAWQRDLAAARDDLEELRARLEELEKKPDQAARRESPVTTEYLITDLGTTPAPEPPAPSIDRAVFADIVLRETVVKAASLAHGVRRGLAPETRNRIRFQMKQEVRRSRKQRRADLKAAQRDLRARQRAELTDLTGPAEAAS